MRSAVQKKVNSELRIQVQESSTKHKCSLRAWAQISSRDERPRRGNSRPTAETAKLSTFSGQAKMDRSAKGAEEQPQRQGENQESVGEKPRKREEKARESFISDPPLTQGPGSAKALLPSRTPGLADCTIHLRPSSATAGPSPKPADATYTGYKGEI